MITITACARTSHTSALRMAASPASRTMVLYEFGNIDMVYARASSICTSKSTRTDDAILHTRFLSGLRYGEGV